MTTPIRCTCRPRLNRLRIKLRRTPRGWLAQYGDSSVEVWGEPNAQREALESLRHFVRLEVEGSPETGWQATGQSATCPRSNTTREARP